MGDDLDLRTQDTERIKIKANGNVGVGTTSPVEKLDVNGDIRCVDLTETSDAQLKTDVQPLGGVIEKLDRIRGVSFRWNAQARSLGAMSETRQIGVLAQELEQVFPELVVAPAPVAVEELLKQYPEEMLTPQMRERLQQDADRSHYKAVSYSKFTAVLLEAVKELKAENQALEQRLEALEAKAQ